MRPNRSDVALLFGGACLVYGVGLMYVPAAWLAAGVLLIVYGLMRGIIGTDKAKG